jgi:subtilisin-like proprotein convertase family protein
MHRRWSLLRFIILTVFLTGLSGAFAKPAEASHFRYGHVTWRKVKGNTVDFTLTCAFRRGGDPITGIPGYAGTAPDGYLAVGDLFDENIGGTTLVVGGLDQITGINGGPLTFICVAIDPVKNYAIARAIDPRTGKDRIRYTFPSPNDFGNPWFVYLFSCCRVSDLKNNAGWYYNVETTVDLGVNGKGSAVSALPPIIPVPRSGATFQVPGADPDGNTLRYRLSTNFEGDGIGFFEQPPGVSIDPVTGEYTVPPGLAPGIWSTQITIEERNAGNAVVGKVSVDFIFDVLPQVTGNAPQYDYDITPPEGAVLNAVTNRPFIRRDGSPVQIVARDPDGDIVTLNTTGGPLGSVNGPVLPRRGRGESSTVLAWVPSDDDVGVYTVGYFAEDENGGFTQTSFTINVIQPLHIKEPNGAEPYLLGDTIPVTWDSPGFNRSGGVKIELSRDAGQTWEVVTNNTEDDGSFAFRAAGDPSRHCILRISSVDEPLDWDVSDGEFVITDGDLNKLCIAPTKISIPDNNENWTTSNLDFSIDRLIRGLRVDVDITHPYIGDLQVRLVAPKTRPDQPDSERARVMLHDSGGADQDDIHTVYGHGRGFTAPVESLGKLYGQRSAGTWTLEVRDLKLGSIGHLSHWCLTVIGRPVGTLAVKSPTPGDRWDIGSTRTINWVADDIQGDLRIQLSRDGGATWQTIDTLPSTTTSLSWKVVGPETRNALIRLVSVEEPVLNATMSGPFEILNPFLKVVRPNGGEKVSIGRPYEIMWDTVPGGGTVTIRLSLDSGETFDRLLTASAPNTGSYTWTPEAGLDSTTARIKITANSGPARSGTSAEDFSIQAINLNLTSPNGSERWYTYTTHPITWQAVGLDGDVKIEVSRDGGDTWNEIATVPAADEQYNWTIDPPASTEAMVRVTSQTRTDVFDVSDEAFEVRDMKVTVLAPNGGEHLGIGTTTTIRWSTEGVPAANDRVDIFISRDGGTTFDPDPIFSNIANTGSVQWTVTGPANDSCVIQVKTSAFPAFDTSDTVFAIVAPNLRIVAPNGGEELRVGHTSTLRWSSLGVDGNVKLEISRDGGATWETLFDDLENSGSKDWEVTGPDSTNALLRISATSQNGVDDVSDAAFAIAAPLITVTSPNGGERWRKGSSQEITWTSRAIVGTVKIELTRDGGETWTTLAESAPNNGRYRWKVTGPGATNCRVRITPEGDPQAADESDGPFTIVKPSLTVTSPNGGERWANGSSHVITWSSTALPGKVKIEVSYSNGQDWATLYPSTANDGAQTWKIRGRVTRKALIRISSVEDSSVRDRSDDTFTIRSSK